MPPQTLPPANPGRKPGDRTTPGAFPLGVPAEAFPFDTGVQKKALTPKKVSGAEEDRTPNLGIANAALSQLSYRPDRGCRLATFRLGNTVKAYVPVRRVSSGW